MRIVFPPKVDGSSLSINDNSSQLTIIGANGAGKSRFTEHLIASLKGRAFRLSALHALYDSRSQSTLEGSIDILYNKTVKNSPFMRDDIESELERCLALLVNDEMTSHIARKFSNDNNKEIQPSKLDIAIKLWQEIFPDNKILMENNELLFSRAIDSEKYNPKKLSDGEKAVLYYIVSIQFAMENAVVFIEDPDIFLHPSIVESVWNNIEELRPDCSYVYTTHNLYFAATRNDNAIVWVKSFDASTTTWDYDILPPQDTLSDDIYSTLIGSRKPVLFIEGDESHSIDSKLYPLIFSEYQVKPLGSCDKVIEATRSFNELKSFHHLNAYGIVDRDRRPDSEVRYLREKKVHVPNVAEIENILMLEEVITAVARRCGKNPNQVFNHVKNAIIEEFSKEYEQQALMHTRHRVKRLVTVRIDQKFPDIDSLENHLRNLVDELQPQPRTTYNNLCAEFKRYVTERRYRDILRVYNRKSMISASHLLQMCQIKGGLKGYSNKVLKILKSNSADAHKIRHAIIRCFGLQDTSPQE